MGHGDDLKEAENYSVPVATMLARAICLAIVVCEESGEEDGEVKEEEVAPAEMESDEQDPADEDSDDDVPLNRLQQHIQNRIDDERPVADLIQPRPEYD